MHITKEKQVLGASLTDPMVKFEGSEAFREVVWFVIEELYMNGWKKACDRLPDQNHWKNI